VELVLTAYHVFRDLTSKEMRDKMAKARRVRYSNADERKCVAWEEMVGCTWYAAGKVCWGREKILDFSLAGAKKLSEALAAGDSLYVPADRN
jgi:hypothetical protein